jgi:hypothetical protein
MVHATYYIPQFEHFYRHPVLGFIITGLVTAALVAFMVYVWATNFGPLAPARRSGGQQPAAPDQAVRDEVQNSSPPSGR